LLKQVDYRGLFVGPCSQPPILADLIAGFFIGPFGTGVMI